MGKIYTLTLLLCLMVALISVQGQALDKSPTAVKKWFRTISGKKQKLTEMKFFLHEASRPPNQTAFTIVEPLPAFASTTLFGGLNIIDDILRAGVEPDSQIIGRAQALAGYSNLDEAGMIVLSNYIFTAGKYNGSSLALHGGFKFSDRYREVEIIGGTGVFRLARGILTIANTLLNATTGGLIGEFHVVVLHYN